jgi:5'-nucleotidase
MYPALEGRFPQVSNISFEFDPAAPAGSRVKDAQIGNAPLEMQRRYKMSTRGYMARGKDGYDSLLVQSEGGEAEEIVNEENGVLISTILRQYFMSLKVIGKWRMWGPSLRRHWGSVQDGMSTSHPVLEPITRASTLAAKTKQATKIRPGGSSSASGVHQDSGASTPLDTEDEAEEGGTGRGANTASEADREMMLTRWVIRKWWRLAGLKGQPATCEDQDHEHINVDWTKVG